MFEITFLSVRDVRYDKPWEVVRQAVQVRQTMGRATKLWVVRQAVQVRQTMGGTISSGGTPGYAGTISSRGTIVVSELLKIACPNLTDATDA